MSNSDLPIRLQINKNENKSQLNYLHCILPVIGILQIINVVCICVLFYMYKMTLDDYNTLQRNFNRLENNILKHKYDLDRNLTQSIKEIDRIAQTLTSHNDSIYDYDSHDYEDEEQEDPNVTTNRKFEAAAPPIPVGPASEEFNNYRPVSGKRDTIKFMNITEITTQIIETTQKQDENVSSENLNEKETTKNLKIVETSQKSNETETTLKPENETTITQILEEQTTQKSEDHTTTNSEEKETQKSTEHEKIITIKSDEEETTEMYDDENEDVEEEPQRTRFKRKTMMYLPNKEDEIEPVRRNIMNSNGQWFKISADDEHKIENSTENFVDSSEETETDNPIKNSSLTLLKKTEHNLDEQNKKLERLIMLDSDVRLDENENSDKYLLKNNPLIRFRSKFSNEFQNSDHMNQNTNSNKNLYQKSMETFEPVAIHLVGDTKKAKESKGKHYIQNAKMSHPSGIFKDWKIDPSFNVSKENFMFDESEGSLSIKQAGLYFVYAQVFYSSREESSGFNIYLNEDIKIRCLITEAVGDSFRGDNRTYPNTCYTGSLLNVKANDKLRIKETMGERYTIFEPARSFFGLYKIK